ncbi:hypothetical protein KFK09_020522 [Dendrobium nobile]|uniref:RNase H type-1 domain-containing protein n=1 Tax=Dendrobium nobile TaxID=94219 RepID=A0A8T3ALJ8_DENNO|nr:hypothetical protein KFK09_020522 [Dendrobium nobile]
MDGNMFQWGKREFAKIRVRVRLDQCLPPGTWVESISGKFYQRFEYEKISTLCYGCDNGNSDKVEDFVADTHLEEGEILDEVGKNSTGRDSELVINSAEEIARSSEEPSKIIGMFPVAINPVDPVCLNKFAVLDGVEEDGMEDACVKKVSRGRGNAGVNTVCGRPIAAEGDKGCEGNLFIGRIEKEASSSGDLVKRKLAKELRALGPIKISSRGRCVDGGSKKKDLASFSVLKTSDQCVIGDLNVFNKGVWMVSTIYASKEIVKRRHLWEVVQEASNRDIPSIVGGDFNCTLSQEDKKGGRRFKTNQGSLDMMKFMNENDYHEVGFVGPRYTWYNNKSGGGRILERLDRCILNTLALNKIQIIVVKHLARVASDHCPIVLKMFEMSCKGRSGIKFEDTWLSFKTAEYIVSSRWKRPFLGDDMEVLNKKCKKTLKDLFYWSKARLKNFSLEKDKLKAEILVLQDEESKLGWLEEDKLWLLKAKEEFMRFFQVKWESRSCSFTGWPKPWTSLLNSDKEMLNRELNDAEISEVILNLGNNRAPGFDGISYSFFNAFWRIIRVDVVRAVQQMVEIMPIIISEEQPAFVKGRSISDHLLLAQEVFNKLRFSKASNGFLAIKVDMEQAYDSMCWATLERMLIELGFPSRFISFAGKMVLVKSVFLSLPVFTMTHSLDPMSTLLEFDKICRDFIWNECDGKRGLHYLAWDHVCKPKEYGGWGVQSSVERRDAMRAKFAWKLIDNPDSLLSRQLNARYGENWWKYRLYGRSSSTWKILFSGWNAIRELVRWKVADGIKINVLKEIWILDKALIRWPTFVATFEDEDVTLDCFISGGSWDRMKLREFFRTDLVDLICKVQISPYLFGDSMELKFNMSGKSTSALIMEERYKNLVWCCSIQMEFLCKRKLADDSLCPLGCDVVEDCNHITTYCCKLRKVLDVLRGWGFQIPVYSGWCECLADLKRHKNGNLMLIKMYFTIIWFVWNHMNKVKHGNPEESNVFIAISILSFISQDHSHIIQSGNWVVNQSFGLSFDKWQPPPPGWIKINIDASLKGNYEVGIGGIVRDCKGRFLLAFGRKKMHWDIAQLEMEAITDLKEALQGRFHGVEGIVVEGDNKNVIDILHNMYSIPKNMDRRLVIEDSFFLNENDLPSSFCNMVKEECVRILHI